MTSLLYLCVTGHLYSSGVLTIWAYRQWSVESVYLGIGK